MKTTVELLAPQALAPGTRENKAPAFASQRMAREWKTIAAMITLHCRGRHRSKAALCAQCQGLLDYAGLRLERCRFGVEKPTCAQCPVHCYPSARRQQIKDVMRYAGPRMVWAHPVISLLHWLDGFRKAPERL